MAIDKKLTMYKLRHSLIVNMKLTLVVLIAVLVTADAWWFGKRDLKSSPLRAAIRALCTEFADSTSTEPIYENVRDLCQLLADRRPGGEPPSERRLDTEFPW
ncbi:hypothetical protein LOTGIDRAFT_239720 [Lottia gigantea]|uniref:Uncharacterized protein n=1 Tax=Lottia gigantea TaxID=225164 RepID=V4AJT7_LOTGI|nr:hypothetical protein LOTGIDRAFT_239720 [Lottia gigantea]ESP04449.1 hypothetical protein LOTGIDRAFT_239720 [Lottia gigantea]